MVTLTKKDKRSDTHKITSLSIIIKKKAFDLSGLCLTNGTMPEYSVPNTEYLCFCHK